MMDRSWAPYLGEWARRNPTDIKITRRCENHSNMYDYNLETLGRYLLCDLEIMKMTKKPKCIAGLLFRLSGWFP